MTDKPKSKHRISHIIVKAIRDRAPNETYNDELARALKLTREQVRNSTRQLMRDHPEFGIRETSPYYYVYDATLVPTGSAPVSAVPHIPTYEELGGEPVAGAYARTMDQIFADDRAANPGKYPPATVGEYARTATKDDVERTLIAHGAFHVIARRGDVVVLADEDNALWAAKKL